MRVLEELDTLQLILVLGLVGGILYALYKIGGSLSSAGSAAYNATGDAIDNVFGISPDSVAGGNTYSSALGQSVFHPLDTLDNIIGFNQNGDSQPGADSLAITP